MFICKQSDKNDLQMDNCAYADAHKCEFYYNDMKNEYDLKRAF